MRIKRSLREMKINGINGKQKWRMRVENSMYIIAFSYLILYHNTGPRILWSLLILWK